MFLFAFVRFVTCQLSLLCCVLFAVCGAVCVLCVSVVSCVSCVVFCTFSLVCVRVRVRAIFVCLFEVFLCECRVRCLNYVAVSGVWFRDTPIL